MEGNGNADSDEVDEDDDAEPVEPFEQKW